VNVGKSTLVNQLLQLQQPGTGSSSTPGPAVAEGGGRFVRRVVTGPTPGLTRDAIRLTLEWQPQRTIQVIDTAGIRRVSPSHHRPPEARPGDGATAPMDAARLSHVESMAIQEAFHACKTADVVALVIDAGAGMLQRSELAMCDAVLQEGRALVVVANKMDLVVEPGSYSPTQFARDVRDQLEARFPLLRKTPIVPVSGLSGQNVSKILPVVWDARERWQKQIPTSQLNRWIRDVQELHSHPAPSLSPSSSRGKPKGPAAAPSSASGKRSVRIKYMLQTKGRPPTFLLYCNSKNGLPDSYVRFLTRHFQDTFQLFGMPVRLAVKQSANPFAPSKSSRR
jgi:GTP-binding protein